MHASESLPPGEVTRLLHAARGGEREALDRILPLVYEELRRMARGKLAAERASVTLQPTALVHEAYFKLAASGSVDAADRAHFLAISARAMRQVLVDYARRRRAAKRGGGWHQTTLSGGLAKHPLDFEELLALDRALDQLDPRQRQIVECRFFAGMEEEEIAVALGISARTVRRDWVKARAWLNRALYVDPAG
jgi:RNA polymerase sigma factor (TIGR02999 family)